MQYLTDGREKYIWFPTTGDEQLFDQRADPGELHDLAREPNHKAHLALWRGRLIAELAERTEDGLSDGEQLIAGKSPPAVRPTLLETEGS